MTQVTLTEKGIGPIEYDGHNYWVSSAENRDLGSYVNEWTNNNLILKTPPSYEEFINVIVKNMDQIDIVDDTISLEHPSLAKMKDTDKCVWMNGGMVTSFKNEGPFPTFLDDCLNVPIYKERIIEKDKLSKKTSSKFEDLERNVRLAYTVMTTDTFKELTETNKVKLIEFIHNLKS